MIALTIFVMIGISYMIQLMAVLFDANKIKTKKEFLIKLIPFSWLSNVIKWYKNLE